MFTRKLNQLSSGLLEILLILKIQENLIFVSILDRGQHENGFMILNLNQNFNDLENLI